MATSESWYDRNGEKQEVTEWHNIVAWEKMSEIAGAIVKKGRTLYVEAKLHKNIWTDTKTGKKRYRIELIAKKIIILATPKSEREAKTEAKPEAEPKAKSEHTQQSIVTDENDYYEGIPF